MSATSFCHPALLTAINKEIPTHRGNKRIWIATNKINQTTLGKSLSYHYTIDTKKQQLIISSNHEKDDRRVTVRKSNYVPIIDINNNDISSLFMGINKIIVKIYEHQIVIEPLKEEKLQNFAKSKLHTKNVTFIDFFSGGGTLSKALIDAGMTSVGAVELKEDYLLNFEHNNPNTFTYNASVTELDLTLLSSKAVVLSAGIPCECYTPSGVVKQKSLGRKSKEAGLTGSLGYFFLQAVEAIRPAVVLIEEVVGFKNSAMADIVRAVLSFRGYSISEKILVGSDYGSMTKRKRFCMVATISNKPFVFSSQSQMNLRTVGDILEVLIKDRVWLDANNSKSIAYSLDKEQKHIEKGQGFRLARTHVGDTVVSTITKGYYQNRLTDPILVHPDDEMKFSWFTPRELARLNGFPDNFLLPEAKTKAGEVIGQGVCYEAFYSVAKDIISHVRAF